MTFSTGPLRRTFTNIYSVLEAASLKHPQAIAYKADGGKGKEYTFQEVHKRVRSLATGLQTGKMAALDQIGLLSENRPEWAIVRAAPAACQ